VRVELERSGLVEVELFSSDAFTAKKEELLSRFKSEYRFEKGDELYVEQGGERPLKVRVIDVRLFVSEDGALKSELLAMKL
jgi:hypothetical protein